MKNQITQSIKIIILGSVLTAGLGFAWNGPSQIPDGGNVPSPINISAISQYKTGGLALGTSSLPQAVSGGSADLFVSGSALTDKLLVDSDAIVQDRLIVGNSNNTNESVEADGLVLSTSLVPCASSGSGNQNPDASHYPAPLCAKGDGTIYVCDQLGTGCVNTINTFQGN